MMIWRYGGADMVKKVTITVIVFVGLIVTFIYMPIILSGALWQEKDPLKHLTSIAKLKLTSSNYEKIREVDNNYVVYLSDTERDDTFENIQLSLEQNGWQFKEQLGSGFIFEKAGEEMVVTSRQYSSSYYLWTVPKGILKDEEE